MLCRLLTLSVCLVLGSCGGSGDGWINESEVGSVTIDANVRLWTDSNLTIDYTLTNSGPLELIVFDVGHNASTDLDENGQVRVLKAKRNTGDTDFDQPPTIAGRNLSPDQTINGSTIRMMPINIDYAASLVSGLTPDTITFCVGYGNADDIIPLTLPDGTYSLNEDLDLQTLVCTILNKMDFAFINNHNDS